jgi:hypothetical protein
MLERRGNSGILGDGVNVAVAVLVLLVVGGAVVATRWGLFLVFIELFKDFRRRGWK